MRRGARLFFVGFLCALCVVGLLFGISVADANTRLTGLRGNEPFFTVQSAGPLRWDVQLFGERAEISLDWLNAAAPYGQKVFCFAPANVRVFVRVFYKLK